MEEMNIFGLTLSDWESIVAIIAMLCAGMFWLIKWYRGASPVVQQVFLREGDIYGLTSDGNERRLTLNASVYEVVFAKRK